MLDLGMRKLWLVFSQTATLCLAALFVVSTLKPEWLPSKGVSLPGIGATVVTVPAVGGDSTPGAPRPNSYNDAVRKAAPSVVNIFTSKEVRTPRNPLLNDPIFRRFFGDQGGEQSPEAPLIEACQGKLAFLNICDKYRRDQEA